MAVVIGLDLGNFNSYASYIEDFLPERTRLGGRAVDLLPVSEASGIPSVFFYAEGKPYLSGRAAVSGIAKPVRNRVRYLKRSLDRPLVIGGRPVEIEGRAWSYNDAIREVAQSVLRDANRELSQLTRQTTDLVSLAYPASFSDAQRERLVQIVESATLEDGRHFRVAGTIAEPAAAALDYMAQCGRREESTALVFDLGGGTFDLCLLSCWPEGKRNADGSLAYYRVHLTDGLPGIGGLEFDEVIRDLLRSKLASYLEEHGLEMTGHTDHIEKQLRQDAEKVKRELSSPPFRTVWEVFIPALDENAELELTREEFEGDPRVRDMLRQMTGLARSMLADSSAPRPDTIVLTGGSCRMPMIREALAAALPEYASLIDGIQEYRFESAVSYGAARFGVPEPVSRDVVGVSDPPGAGASSGQRTARDLGIRYYRDAADTTGYIVSFIRAGSRLPITTPWASGASVDEETGITYELYEAISPDPDPAFPERDYRLIRSLTVGPGSVMKADTETEIRLSVQADGLVVMEGRVPGTSGTVRAEVQLKDPLS